MAKAFVVFICCILGVFYSVAQPPTWQWAKGSHGVGVQEGNAVASDRNGNVYIIGTFEGNSISFDSVSLSSPGLTNFFIGKYSYAGLLLWARSATISADASVSGVGVTTDESNNVYVAGNFNGTSITFGSIRFSPSNASVSTFFVAKYDSLGTVLWVKSVDRGVPSFSALIAKVSGITADKNGNVYITGLFEADSVDFGGVVVYNLAQNADFFIAKFSPEGNALWAKNAALSYISTGNSCATDESNNVYITGTYTGPGISFGGITQNSPTQLSSDGIFIVKYDSLGNAKWAKTTGGTNNDAGLGVATDFIGNVFATGYFSSDAIGFDAHVLLNQERDSCNAGNCKFQVYLVKIDPSGNTVWLKGQSSYNQALGYGVATDLLGNVYVVGGVHGNSLIFDSTVLLRPDIYADPMFMISFGPNGNELCGFMFGSGGDDVCGVCTDRFGNVCIGGDYYMVNPFIIGNDSLYLTSDSTYLGAQENVFVAKFNCGVKTTDLENISEEALIQIYPNPFSSHAVVQYSMPWGVKNGVLTISDLFGRQLNNYELNNIQGQIEINTNNLNSGVYFYSLVSDGKPLLTKKMVVQN